MACKFCGSEETVSDKSICLPCLRQCVLCNAEEGDDTLCPRLYSRVRCGTVLEAGCEMCGGDKGRGFRYCPECYNLNKLRRERTRFRAAKLGLAYSTVQLTEKTP